MKAQIASLTEKSDAWATAILQGHLDQKMFWQGLHNMIWPTLCYPLAVSTILEAVAAGITKKLYKALLHSFRKYSTFTFATLWYKILCKNK